MARKYMVKYNSNIHNILDKHSYLQRNKRQYVATLTKILYGIPHNVTTGYTIRSTTENTIENFMWYTTEKSCGFFGHLPHNITTHKYHTGLPHRSTT